MTSYLGRWYFGMYGKRRPLAILWYQLHVSGGFHFQVHRGGYVRRVTKKGLVRRRLIDFKQSCVCLCVRVVWWVCVCESGGEGGV